MTDYKTDRSLVELIWWVYNCLLWPILIKRKGKRNYLEKSKLKEQSLSLQWLHVCGMVWTRKFITAC